MTKTGKHNLRRCIVSIPDTYYNALSCGFCVIEEMLSDISGAITRETQQADPATLEQLQQLEKEISNLQMQVQEVTTALNLDSTPESLQGILMSRCAKIWQVLCELRTDRLHGYGETPKGLPQYLDPRIDSMIRCIDSILVVMKKQ